MAIAEQRILVIGGGITGLAAAVGLCEQGAGEVVLTEADSRLGGKISSSEFAGVPTVDEGPDAFLTRGGEALGFAARVGVTELVAPASASAAVWFPRGKNHLHPIPGGLVLGVPAALRPMAASSLLSWRGKLRAGLEPFVPRTPLDPDALGPYMRARLGSEVHERLIDALIGSIYASDTDHSSLEAVPQVAALAKSHRSLLLAARKMRASAPPASGEPIFSAPRSGMQALVDHAETAIIAAGGQIRLGRSITEIAPADSSGWLVDGEHFDQVIIAVPAAMAAPLLRTAAPEAADLLAVSRHASVTMVTLAIPADQWPTHLHKMSGYLVPKPVQTTVTAASFGSQKWSHWARADGQQILRISLGRAGLDLDHLDDAQMLDHAVREVNHHLNLRLAPTQSRITRWVQAFPQYQPRHHEWVAATEKLLPQRLHLAGASYRGIGIPTCLRDADRAVQRVLTAH
jgi:protoporphyrinogen/coproporphyrinogen III oxidase